MTRVAALQMTSGNRVAANLNEAAGLLARAAEAGARLAVLPENFALMTRSDAERRAAAEPDGHGPIQDFLADTACRLGLWIVGGTLPVRTEGAKVRAACMVYDSDGVRRARYDKIHLFDVELGNGERYYESNGFEAGADVVTLSTPAGRLGLAVCYDLRFPELFRRLLDAGAEVVAVPAAFTAYTGRAHWEILVRARAIENLVYVIAAGQGGRHADGRETHGDSMIVNPWGEVLARWRVPEPAVVSGECDPAQLQALRRQLPSIEHRRLR
jgi:nitrilase